jgi:SAM-dependent methyltransferase
MLILDSTCGFRKMWRGRRPSNVVFMDIRKECRPDVVGDLKNMPFKDEAFDVIYFDPPHHIPAKGFMYNYAFGEGLTPTQRVRLFYEANKEFSRVLKRNGLLFCKTTNMPKNPGFSSKYMHLCLEEMLTNFQLYARSMRPSSGRSKEAMVCHPQV